MVTNVCCCGSYNDDMLGVFCDGYLSYLQEIGFDIADAGGG